MKLIIVILSTIILGSCAPIEAIDKLPDYGKLIVIVLTFFIVAVIFGHPELKFNFIKSKDYENYEQEIINKLQSLYWLLIIAVILLIIILYKIW